MLSKEGEGVGQRVMVEIIIDVNDNRRFNYPHPLIRVGG